MSGKMFCRFVNIQISDTEKILANVFIISFIIYFCFTIRIFKKSFKLINLLIE